MTSNSTTTFSSSFIIELQLISRYLNMSFGFFLFITGTLGNLFNAITFLSIGHYKHNPCSLYMLVKALLDLSAVFIGLSTRILAAGFQIDWALNNRIWCKIRRFWITTNNVISFSLLTVQSIDVFFCSSPSFTLRQLSNITYARRIVIGILLLGSLHSAPFLYYQNLVVTATGSASCNTVSGAYNKYQLYFINLCLYLAIPILVIFIFGLLIYSNIHSNYTNIQRRILSSAVQQVIRMSLYNMVIVVVFVTPYGIIQLYSLLIAEVVRTAIRIAQEQLVSSFTTIYFYGAYASSFYCYYVSSKRFRQQFWSTLSNLPTKIRRRRRNRIYPFSQHIIPFPVVQQITTRV